LHLLQISDIHGSVSAAEKSARRAIRENVDAILTVGDITHFGTIPQAEALLSKIAEVGKTVYFVPGNCDPEAMLDWSPANSMMVNLHLGTLRLGDISLGGLGGGNTSPFDTLIEFTEEQFQSMLMGLTPPTENFVLLSHTPPYGTEADFARGRHVGSKAVYEYIKRVKPILVCCGHIHEARSISTIGQTKIINAGPARDGKCAVITITRGRAEAELLDL